MEQGFCVVFELVLTVESQSSFRNQVFKSNLKKTVRREAMEKEKKQQQTNNNKHTNRSFIQEPKMMKVKP